MLSYQERFIFQFVDDDLKVYLPLMSCIFIDRLEIQKTIEFCFPVVDKDNTLLKLKTRKTNIANKNVFIENGLIKSKYKIKDF